MKVGIIGCGLIGKKRAYSLQNDDELIACCDTDSNILMSFQEEHKCIGFSDYKKLFDKCDIEVVVVAVVNKFTFPIVNYALNNKIHVLVEKPLGRNYIEAEEMLRNSVKNQVVLKTGFNHRFHPGIWRAKELLDEGSIGELIFIRARYGHGGRPGMENEWRSSKELCGGGELLDQGVHIIDLSRWFAGEIEKVFAKVDTKFWNMGVEDNAFVYMESSAGVSIHFHVSWTNWKNIFSFEAFGKDGYLKIDGLGGSYGEETLQFGYRNKKGGIPNIQNFSFSTQDVSWEEEWNEFKTAIAEKRNPIGDAMDGYQANLIIEKLYQSSREGSLIQVKNGEKQ